MGTRCLTHVKDGDKKAVTLVTIYRQYDGYPKGHGQELKKLFGNTEIINGIGAKQKAPKRANIFKLAQRYLEKEIIENVTSYFVNYFYN